MRHAGQAKLGQGRMFSAIRVVGGNAGPPAISTRASNGALPADLIQRFNDLGSPSS